MGTILIVILLLLLIGGLPTGPWWGATGHSFGYYPSSILGVVLVVVIVLLLLGRL